MQMSNWFPGIELQDIRPIVKSHRIVVYEVRYAYGFYPPPVTIRERTETIYITVNLESGRRTIFNLFFKNITTDFTLGEWMKHTDLARFHIVQAIQFRERCRNSVLIYMIKRAVQWLRYRGQNPWDIEALDIATMGAAEYEKLNVNLPLRYEI